MTYIVTRQKNDEILNNTDIFKYVIFIDILFNSHISQAQTHTHKKSNKRQTILIN